MGTFRITHKLAGALAVAAALAGCASYSPDGGMVVVADTAAAELGHDVAALRTPDAVEAARARVAGLLARRLAAGDAVQIALLNNRGLQAAYNELGLAEVAMVTASLPPNPGFSVERISGTAEIEIEKRIIANVLSLATLPVRAEIAGERFRQAQLRAAEETLRIAAETRRAYYRAVALRETETLLARARTAAETATRLAARLGESGAINKLDQAREQVFYAEITAELARARQAAASERERLTRLMGLWGKDVGFKLPPALPVLPRRPDAMPQVEREAVARRIDLRIARIEVDALARTHGLTEATRFVNLLEVSGVGKTTRERETGERIRDRGFEVEFQIPVFDLGEGRARQASEAYLQAVNRLTEKAINVRSQARDAYRAYRSAYDIAAHYQREVLPLRKLISDEMLLRYNAMQIDVFALLADARGRTAAIEARRDFWLASVNLAVAIVGGGAVADGEASTAAVTMPAGETGGH
ncbi:TolC family protein [Xanthobacteraceae bacterium Astr-EGSB]|uniref:TolC family protein n=1 Tax=Astrobacterium formosum TaxID=3069710 RepID=UPI0027B13339|nr:TolC family protein [Xanthobacteraceae bacterium Astr-EGSB]